MLVWLWIVWMGLAGGSPNFSGGPHGDWWPPTPELKQVAEYTLNALKKAEVVPEQTVLDWPPAAVEIRLRPDWGQFMHVGGLTDYRQLGCWRLYHITLSVDSSIVHTIGCATNRDTTCKTPLPEEMPYLLIGEWRGVSPLVERARETYEKNGCVSSEAFAWVHGQKADQPRGGYYYRTCGGELVVELAQ